MISMARFSLAVLALCLPAVVAAQEPETAPDVGSYGVSFRLPDGGGVGLGLRRMVSSTANLGLEAIIGLRWQDIDVPAGPQPSRTTWSLGVQPNLRLYRSVTGPVLPFVALATTLAYQRDSGPLDAWSIDVGASTGVGAEWFPTEYVSVSGATGLDLTYRRATSGDGQTNRVFNLGVFRSDLFLNLYF